MLNPEAERLSQPAPTAFQENFPLIQEYLLVEKAAAGYDLGSVAFRGNPNALHSPSHWSGGCVRYLGTENI